MTNNKCFCPNCERLVIPKKRGIPLSRSVASGILTLLTCGLGIFVLPVLIAQSSDKLCPMCGTGVIS